MKAILCYVAIPTLLLSKALLTLKLSGSSPHRDVPLCARSPHLHAAPPSLFSEQETPKCPFPRVSGVTEQEMAVGGSWEVCVSHWPGFGRDRVNVLLRCRCGSVFWICW